MKQNKGTVSSFFFLFQVLRKVFLQRGKAGARSLGKPLVTWA